jgi:hypothetical protein
MAADAETMALCAIRYTMGRRSYIVADGQRWAREWGAKSAWVRDVLIRDLRDDLRRCDMGVECLGEPHDERGWRAALAELEKLQAASAGRQAEAP